MAVKVAINGFGRIGRLVLRAALKNKAGLDIVAVNDLTDSKTLAHLFKYDSVHGKFDGTVEVDGNDLIINGDRLRVVAEKDPAKLPWKELGAQIVLESTGRFTDKEKAGAHFTAGAKKVIISAPAKGEDITIVMGVNDKKYDPAKHHLISNASCTTNCLVPVVHVLREKFGWVRGYMITVHAYTNDQVILDFPHKDLRRARAAGLSMIPTSTGAAKAIGLVLPQLKGKLDGTALRVPTADVSSVNLVATVEKSTTVEEVNNAFKAAASGPLKGVLEVSDEPLVSIDYTGNPASSTVDLACTQVVDGVCVQVSSWYDNEWGYSSRCVDLIKLVAKSL